MLVLLAIAKFHLSTHLADMDPDMCCHNKPKFMTDRDFLDFHNKHTAIRNKKDKQLWNRQYIMVKGTSNLPNGGIKPTPLEIPVP
uniref:Uncharacterized protein n=1 Tax=Anguilla anguilla TaxID=7936 RepID=A0A0E9WHQ0_ANGAN